MHLAELVVVGRVGDGGEMGRVGDGGEMENEVDLGPAEVVLQVHGGEVPGDDVAFEALQVFEIAGAEIVHHGELGLGITAGHFVDQVRPDEAGPAGDDDVLVHGADATQRKAAI